MLLGKVDCVGWLVEILRQVKDVELFGLVNDKELTHARHKLPFVSHRRVETVEVQPTPRNLDDWVPTCLVPHSQR